MLQYCFRRSFSIRYVLYQYKTQQIRDKAVDFCLAVLKFVSHLFVTSKMIKILFTDFHADRNILYFNEDSGNVTFCCNEMAVLSVKLNNIDLDNSNYEKDDPDTSITIKLQT